MITANSSKIVCWFIIIFFSLCCNAEFHQVQWFDKTADGADLNVYLFVNSNCPHCHSADIYLNTMSKKYPWIRLKRFVINQDLKALQFFNQIQADFNYKTFHVPAIFFCKSHWIGFSSKNAQKIMAQMEYCRQKILLNGDLDLKSSRQIQNMAKKIFYQNIFSQLDNDGGFKLAFKNLINYNFLWLSIAILFYLYIKNKVKSSKLIFKILMICLVAESLAFLMLDSLILTSIWLILSLFSIILWLKDKRSQLPINLSYQTYVYFICFALLHLKMQILIGNNFYIWLGIHDFATIKTFFYVFSFNFIMVLILLIFLKILTYFCSVKLNVRINKVMFKSAQFLLGFLLILSAILSIMPIF